MSATSRVVCGHVLTALALSLQKRGQPTPCLDNVDLTGSCTSTVALADTALTVLILLSFTVSHRLSSINPALSTIYLAAVFWPARFDLLFVLMDRPDEVLDQCVSEHVLALHSGLPGKAAAARQKLLEHRQAAPMLLLQGASQGQGGPRLR